MARKFDLVIDQGSDYEVSFPVLDPSGQAQDLSGWSARSQVRGSVADVDVLHDFATELTLTGSSVTLTVPAAVSTTWAWTSAVYDLEVAAPGGAVTRLAEGAVIVRPEVTR